MISGARVDEFDNQLNDPGQYDNSQDPASLSVAEHIRALSLRGKLTLAYIIFVLLFLLFKTTWVFAFVTAVAFTVSAALLLSWWNRIRSSCPLDLVVRSFGVGLFAMFWAVMFVFYFASIMLMRFFGFSVLVGYLLPVLFIGLEEMFKVIFVMWSKRGVAIERETKAHQIAATATSLGYAVGFTFMIVTIEDISFDTGTSTKPGSLGELEGATICLIIVTLFGTPMHLLSGYLIGLEVTRQTTLMKVGLFTFLMRSLYILNIMLWISLLDQWFTLLIGLLTSNVLICAAMVWRIKRVESTLSVEYLRRVGNLQAFGYGVLPGGDADEVELPSTFNANNLV